MKRTDINASGHLTHLVSPHLFNSGLYQVFDAKTGAMIGTIRNGQDLPPQADQEQEQTPEPEPVNPSQLKLF